MEDQGRQEHGEFGHGTAPPKIKDRSNGGGLFDEAEVEKRAQAVAYGVIGALPQNSDVRQKRNLARQENVTPRLLAPAWSI